MEFQCQFSFWKLIFVLQIEARIFLTIEHPEAANIE